MLASVRCVDDAARCARAIQMRPSDCLTTRSVAGAKGWRPRHPRQRPLRHGVETPAARRTARRPRSRTSAIRPEQKANPPRCRRSRAAIRGISMDGIRMRSSGAKADLADIPEAARAALQEQSRSPSGGALLGSFTRDRRRNQAPRGAVSENGRFAAGFIVAASTHGQRQKVDGSETFAWHSTTSQAAPIRCR